LTVFWFFKVSGALGWSEPKGCKPACAAGVVGNRASGTAIKMPMVFQYRGASAGNRADTVEAA